MKRTISLILLLAFGLWGLVTTLDHGPRWAVFVNGIATGAFAVVVILLMASSFDGARRRRT